MKYFTEATIEKIRQGYYSAVYFNRTKKILLGEGNLKKASIQIFQRKKDSILCGIEEVKELFLQATGFFEKDMWINKSGELNVQSLSDGENIGDKETVMHLTGPYAYFSHLESIYLGILARRTLIASNMKRCVNAAGNKDVIFFGDRFDYFLNQEGDGYAAKIGGAAGVCTDAQTAWFGGLAVGTIPHALIAVNDGKVEKAAELFNKYYPQVNLIALVDFENDCCATSLSVARKLGKKLWGVRIDTAQENTDKSLENQEGQNGVNPKLVRNVREALNDNGFGYVKIIVSGGFYPEKIRRFIKTKSPVDAFGVGSVIIHGENDFTADVVKVEGKSMAKTGRVYKKNPRLIKLI